MARRGLLAAAAALTAVAAMPVPAVAQNAASDAARLKLMLECDAVKSEAVRLTCYDSAARRSRASMGSRNLGMLPGRPAAQPLSPEQRFGMTPQLERQLSDRPVGPAPVEEITARVASASDNGIGMWQIAFIDGSLWRMTEGDRGFAPPRAGDEVRIRKGAMGGYLLYVGQQPSVRVARYH